MSAVESLLYRALHRYTRSGERWAELRATGASDEAMEDRIASEFGSWGTVGPRGDCASFDGPTMRFWLGSTPSGPPTLQGKALTDKARALLRIPRPQPESAQAPLFEDFPK